MQYASLYCLYHTALYNMVQKAMNNCIDSASFSLGIISTHVMLKPKYQAFSETLNLISSSQLYIEVGR